MLMTVSRVPVTACSQYLVFEYVPKNLLEVLEDKPNVSSQSCSGTSSSFVRRSNGTIQRRDPS